MYLFNRKQIWPTMVLIDDDDVFYLHLLFQLLHICILMSTFIYIDRIYVFTATTKRITNNSHIRLYFSSIRCLNINDINSACSGDDEGGGGDRMVDEENYLHANYEDECPIIESLSTTGCIK